jgi:hypothetical protein
MSTPTSSRASACAIWASRAGHLQHFRLGLDDGTRLHVTLCVSVRDLDFDFQPPAGLRAAGQR